MPELVRYHGQVTAQSSSNLQPVASRTVLVTRRGATINETSGSQTTFTVHAGATRFAVNDWAVLHNNEAQFKQVTGITDDNTLVFGTAITFSDGDRFLNLGNDTASGGIPVYDGATRSKTAGNWNFQIYSDPNGDDAVSNNTLTTDADGEYAFYAPAGTYDITVLDSSGNVSSDSQTLADVHVGLSGDSYVRVEATSALDQEIDINDAIVRVNAQGGGVVELGVGTFTVSSNVAPLANVWIRGQGMNSTIVKAKATGSGYYPFMQLSSSKTSWVRISDLTVDGNTANFGSVDQWGILMRNIETCLIENVEVKNCGSSGIQVQAFNVDVDRITYRNCYVHDVVLQTTLLANSGLYVSASDGKTINDVVIENNTLENIGYNATYQVVTAGVANAINVTGAGDAGSGGGVLNRVRVSNNNMKTVSGGGIKISGLVNKVFANNNVIASVALSDPLVAGSAGNGIFVANGNDVVVDGNIVDTVGDGSGNADNGIELTQIAASDAIVSNNRVTNVTAGTGKVGIFIGINVAATVIGNHIHNTASGGISLANITGDGNIGLECSVTGNTITAAAGTGIVANGRTGVTIGNNTIDGCGIGINVRDDTHVSNPGVGTINTVITGNMVSDGTSAGLRVVGADVEAEQLVVSGNIFYNNADNGIVMRATGATITGNVIEENELSGIEFGNGADCVISGNMLKNNATANTGADKYGILLNGTNDNVSVFGNMIVDHGADAGKAGIATAGTQTRLHIGDNFFQNNTADFLAGTGVQVITAVGDTLVSLGSVLRLTADNSYILTSTPTLADGYANQEILIINEDTADTITIQDEGNLAGTNLRLSAATIALAPRDSIRLMFNATIGDWFQIGQTNVV